MEIIVEKAVLGRIDIPLNFQVQMLSTDEGIPFIRVMDYEDNLLAKVILPKELPNDIGSLEVLEGTLSDDDKETLICLMSRSTKRGTNKLVLMWETWDIFHI